MPTQHLPAPTISRFCTKPSAKELPQPRAHRVPAPALGGGRWRAGSYGCWRGCRCPPVRLPMLHEAKPSGPSPCPGPRWDFGGRGKGARRRSAPTAETCWSHDAGCLRHLPADSALRGPRDSVEPGILGVRTRAAGGSSLLCSGWAFSTCNMLIDKQELQRAGEPALAPSAGSWLGY